MSTERTAWRIYWPDANVVGCNEPGCRAESDDRMIAPLGRRVTVADFLAAVDEHANEFHTEPQAEGHP